MNIFDVEFWAARLRTAIDRDKLYHAVWVGGEDLWHAAARKHKAILGGIVAPGMSILDVGCGWGRLLTLLPPRWHGTYVGIDIVPAFLGLARAAFPQHTFLEHDAREPIPGGYDLAVLVSIRAMVQENSEDWPRMEANVRAAARRILYLEYDADDPGRLE